MLERRLHHETGEVCYALHDFQPPARFAARERRGLRGLPHLSLWVFADRVELERGWCYTSGHMESYEVETEATFRPREGTWPPALGPAISDWFGPAVAAAALARLADPAAFA